MYRKWHIKDIIAERWEIVDIKFGGMGVVYVVLDHKYKGGYAIKTFKEELLEVNPLISDRFYKESLTWINIENHPNIVQANWFEVIEHKPSLILEYIFGGDLSYWIGTPRLIKDPLRVLRFALQFCDGMIHATSKGVKAHRDIKPQNCLVTRQGELKITDFGLARVFDDAHSIEIGNSNNYRKSHADGDDYGRHLNISITRSGAGAGTPYYMPPEQFEDAKHVGIRSDIYSFGVMLYEMLTGRLPFNGSTWEELKLQHKTAKFPSLKPEKAIFKKILQSCVEKLPGNRVSDFSLLRSELTEIWKKLTHENVPEPSKIKNMDTGHWYNKGASLVALERYKEGISCLDIALEKKPDDWMALVNKGAALCELDKPAEALVAYDHALEVKPASVELLSNKSYALNKLNRPNEALQCAEQALIIDEYNPILWINKGQSLRRLKKFDEALSCYNHAISLDSYCYEAWFDKGDILLVLHRSPQECLKCAEKCLSLNSRKYHGWLLKAEALARIGKLDDGLTCYDRALELGVPSDIIWKDKGIAFLGNGREVDAIACFEKYLENNPEEGPVWLIKGVALLMNSQADMARECFVKAKNLGTLDSKAVNSSIRDYLEGRIDTSSMLDMFNAQFGYQREADNASRDGLVSAISGHPEQAVKHFEQALKAKESATVWYNKGRALAELGKFREALECLDRALELDRNDPEIWINRGAMFAQLERYDEELDAYDHALELNPNYSEAWYNKSIILVSKGRVQEAIECLDQLLRIDHADAGAWYQKGALLLDQSNFTEALKCFKKAQDLGLTEARAAVAWCTNKV